MAWVTPPGKRVGSGGRDVTLGTWANAKGVPDPVIRALDDLYRIQGAHLGTYEPIAGNVNGIHLTPAEFLAQENEVLQFFRLVGEEMAQISF